LIVNKYLLLQMRLRLLVRYWITVEPMLIVDDDAEEVELSGLLSVPRKIQLMREIR